MSRITPSHDGTPYSLTSPFLGRDGLPKCHQTTFMTNKTHGKKPGWVNIELMGPGCPGPSKRVHWLGTAPCQ